MISGTFIDEITHDIPYQNWGPDEWARDFAAMRSVGIDTVIIIRAGYKDRATFQSKVLQKLHPHLLVQDDLVGLYLTLAEEHGMTLFFGTYDSGHYWHSGQYEKEADINKAFADEVMERYGHMKALGGWYLCHETDAFNDGLMKVYESLASHLRSLKDMPILISPYIRGVKQFAEKAITLDDHEREWDQVFARISGMVDIVAFQDGNVDYPYLAQYLQTNARLAHKHGLRCWSNVESFDRDMPINFPPIGWPKLRYKIDAAMSTNVEKLITFEFSHFMSPNATVWPSARMLFERYREQYILSGNGRVALDGRSHSLAAQEASVK
ncbi:MAG: DUF4434 domain-containing protein [Sumerlaeia bacterium]